MAKNMSSLVVDVIKSTGYFGILLLMLVENIFPPIPSEIIMPLSGYLVSSNSLNFVLVIAAGTTGTMIGGYVLYFLGAKVGKDGIRHFSDQHGRWFAIYPEDIDKTQRWFDKYGNWTVLFFRLIPGMRSLISVPAGIVKMPILTFSIYTFIGTFAWTTLLTYAGLLLGKNFEVVQKYIGPISSGVVMVLFGLYLYRLIRRK